MVRGGAMTISSDVRGGATIETQLRFDVRGGAIIISSDVTAVAVSCRSSNYLESS